MFSEVLEDVGEEEHVGPEVEVVVVAKACAAEGAPDPFSVSVVAIGEAFAGELAVESLLRREGLVIQSGPAVHILVGVDLLAEQEGTPLEVRLVVGCDGNVLRVAGFYQAIQA